MIAATERDSLTDEVTAIVRRSAKIPAKVAIRPESRLVEDLAIDSLDLVSLVLQIQDDFDVVLDEDAVPNLCRVADIVEYLAASREGMAGKGDRMVRNSGPYGGRGDLEGDGMVRNSGPYGGRGDAGGDGVVRNGGPSGGRGWCSGDGPLVNE
jgi:acyl carrier protein